ncbi:MAG: ABC-2 transporter permease [Gemmatimonadota bacterium]|jgi:Cu-processing system permease protein
MNTTARIALYELRDVVRGKWLLLYGFFFLALAEGLFRFVGDASRVMMSLSSVVVLLVPLVGVLFGTVYLYGAREFNELLLSQPVNRRQMFAGLYLGLALPLAGTMVVGTGIPFLAHGLHGGRDLGTLLILLGSGAALTLVFVGLAFLIALSVGDRLRGLGSAIVLWLAFSFLYDGLVLLGVTAFADYPLEAPLIGAVLLNPVDLGRILLLMRLDVAALMGYTGATFEAFFGTTKGLALATAALALWIATPVLIGFRLFSRKDF